MASSSSGGYVSRYDVFLSFRGEDTRDSFTDHLYQALRRAGVYTLRDNDSISRGEDLQPRIEEGIRESRASIIVLSENYATSRWCLDELCLILEQRHERDHYVLPIFYHVDPSHVRNQEGTFQINVVPDTKWTDDNVKRWKAALEKVGQMTGKVAISGPETIFLGEVVDIIKQRLDLKQVYRKGNLVGMETRDKEINSWLEQSDSDIFAIWGMPGSGKTTLAEHIVYSNWHKFESHSILQDIGSSSTDQYLRQLQKRLIKVITEGKPRKILSVSHGTCIIEEALRNKKALIVLDDIVTKKQLDALIGTGITTKSKIIITTRERNSSKWFQSTSWRCQEHEMKLLDDGDSFELLSLFAFEPNAPINGYEELMRRALVYCGGNPLALQVLGSSLKGSQGSWESTLTLFEREVSGNLQEVLIKSYNSLQQNIQKQLFLHIACFFIGKDKEYVEKILGPDYCAKSEIVNLTNSCLLSVSPNNKLMMHQLLLAMARKIVDEESQTHPENRSRVWRDSESYNVLKKEKGSTNVKGLALDMEVLGKQQIALGKKQLSDVVNTRSFENMDSLQLLKLNQLKLTGTYQYIFKELRWLCWREFFLEAIPPELDMENLVAIDMSCSKLKVFQPPDVLPLLQILNLTDSHNLVEVQNISRVPKLDTLVLENCRSLVRVCHTLGDLTSLTSLNLTGCENLCNGIQPQFVFPSSLKQLFLMDCNLKDTHFSPAFYSLNNQPHLEYLNLAVNLCELLPSYTHLKNIQALDLSSCTALKKLLYLPSNLTELYIFDCSSLETVTFDLHKFTLQEFRYEGCVNLSEVEDFFKLLLVASLTGDQLKHMNWLRAYQDLEVCLVGDDDLTKGRTLRLQMLYEFNIMSISLPDIEKPNMIPENEYISEDPKLSFNIPESHRNRKLRGLNLTFKYTLQGDEWVWFAKIRTNNGVDLIYNAKVFGKPAANEVGIWLSYWPIGESLHDGDEVNVAIVVTKGLEIHGCGASLVYTDEEDEIESFEDGAELMVDANEICEDNNEPMVDANEICEDNNEPIVDANEICEDNNEPMVDANEIFEDKDEPFEDNNEHADILGPDISRYKLSTGTYYLCRQDYSQLMEIGRLTPNWFKDLVGGTIDYTEIGGWRKTGRPDQPYQSYTELKTARCIIYGPELEHSIVAATVEDTSSNHDKIWNEFAHLRVPLEYILSATNNFAQQNIIGHGNLIKVYKGQLLWSGELIDVDARRFTKEREQADQEFWMEISMLSSLKHKNLVSLVGFCDENDEKIIIIRRENRGSLSNYLSDPMLLTWVRRLEISVGIAQALSYIHYDEPRDFSIIHRNINSGTVLLNDDWEPKLSDFELSMKIKASERRNSFYTDKVWSMDEYTDPTYIETKSANHKSDMYSFGIVMFELLCGRKAVINDDHDNKYLASVAVTHYREKKLSEIIDWDLWSQMDSQSFNIFAETAYDCLNEERSKRPNIDEIVTRLEKALELQLEHQNEIRNEFAHLRVSLENILSATNNFAQQNLILEDGFEKRYKGQLLLSGELIDIHARRLNKEWFDGDQQFWMEISMLSSLKHKNLVSLVGFSDEYDEKIIITKLETRGSLGQYLSDPMLLTWVRRLKISVGIAQALSYIHYDEPRDFSVIHRNINSGTILLNDDWEPKLCDFQCSMKIEASQRHHSFHTNKLMYVEGYGDPTYIETKSVNHKSDMYSFGIILFELLCGRKSIIDDQDKKYLGPMAIFHYKKKILDEIIDPVLLKQMDPQSFNVFTKTAYDCLNEKRSRRSDISEVITRLEEALKLQLARQNVEHSIVAATVEDTSSNYDKEEIYKIAEFTKSSLLNETVEDVDINETMKSTSSLFIENKGNLVPILKLNLPPPYETSLAKFLTESGTSMDGDLLVNRDGVRIVSQSQSDTPPLIQPSDNQLSLADFDAVKVVGKGNSGIVRLVQHKWTGQFFALKVIQMNVEESARKLIAQELKINQSSQSTNVVVCYQSFYDNGAVSIILEYMDGGSLADFLKTVRSIPEPYLAAICKQVLNGLWYLHHEKHIIHRDLKPSNLLINHRGEVKITDFGVSAILASTSGLANTFVGTYNYMSPERIIGGNYGYKSDIWSLGLVLLECATGHFPYSPPQPGEGWVNVYELMETIVGQAPPRAPAVQFSPQFCSFIEACVQKDPKDRASAYELMSHPFINMYDDMAVDLASYFTEVGSPLATL